MLVVVFDNEANAYKGKEALQRLDAEGSISVYGYAVVAKSADGSVNVKQGDDVGPMGTLLGTSFGSLIGLLAGPAGVALGAAAGMAAGSTVDLDNIRVGSDFVDDVQKGLSPKKVALIAEIEEEWTTPVDTKMEAVGGTVYRRALSEVQDKVNEEDAAAMKADLAQLKAEHAKAQADRKAKLQAKITELDSKIQAQLQKTKDRREEAKKRAQERVRMLEAKADELKAKAS
jgi:uncharacterized membrane protein